MNLSTQIEVFDWQPACVLKVTGPDAGAFLQGQFTNELRNLAPARAMYGLWLNVKGKVVGDSFVLRGGGEDEFWLVSYHSGADVVRERLESHIIADDVTVEDRTAAMAAITLFGAGAPARLMDCRQRLGADGAGLAFAGRRTRNEHVEWIFARELRPQIRALLGEARWLDGNEIDRRRITDLIPAVPVDIGPGDLPNEGGLEEAAISYTKGCYLGQEVMARLKSMGQVRRRLRPVAGSVAGSPPLPAPLFTGGRRVGELRSIARTAEGGIVGLAMVSLLHADEDQELSLAVDAAPALRTMQER